MTPPRKKRRTKRSRNEMADNLQDDSKPARPGLPGNLQGTLAGAVATMASGYLLKIGAITKLAAYFCDGTSSCQQIENAIFLLAIAIIGGAVNYAVTHSAQAKRLAELYDMIPSVLPPGTPEKNAGNKTGKTL